MTAGTLHFVPQELTASAEFSDWRWQLKSTIRTAGEVNDFLALFTSHRIESSSTIEQTSEGRFPLRVTPYMLVALKRALEASVPGAWEAFRWSFIPSELEFDRLGTEEDGTDGIGEELPSANPVAAVTNFYRNRVLFRVTTMCPAYCRYCFRRRMVGDGLGAWDDRSIEEGIQYIGSDPAIHEVVLSGGDPLVLSDRRLSNIVWRLKTIPHVRRLRIDTRALTMMPSRVTDDLLDLLHREQPFYLILHFSHIYELTEQTRLACSRLADAGVPLRAHIPLLKGVNDNEENLASLMEALVDTRVQPYYLIQFIPTKWTEHFRVPIARGIEIMNYLHKNCGGLSTPTYIVYLPNARGKVPISPQYILARSSEGYLFTSLDGTHVLYPEPYDGSVQHEQPF
jgi:lysine 2,3-aminomutase